MIDLLAPFLAAFLVSLAGAYASEAVAPRLGLLAHPREDRWRRRSVPMLGGVAIMTGVVAALAILGWATTTRFGPFLLVALAMGGVGLLDDFRSLRPPVKLVAQILLAALLLQLGLLLRLTPYAALNVLLTLVWVVGITNAFNLLDNMDGLAAGMAVLVGGFRLAFFLMDGDVAAAAVMAGFVGASVGFLVRNFPPAKIFMGDAGSLFVGFFLGGVCLVGDYAYSRGVAAVLVFPVLLLLIPIFDTTFVTLTRLVTGRPISHGASDHTSHRLVALGITERQALALMCGVSVLFGLLAILSYRYGFTYTVVLLALMLVGLVLLGVHLSRAQVMRTDAAQSEAAIVRLVEDFPFKRHVATVGIDLVMIVAAYYSAYLLRFEAEFQVHRQFFLRTIAPVIMLQVASLALCGAYRGLWRYTGLPDLLRLARGATIGVTASVLYFVFTTRFEGLSRTVFVLDWVLLLGLLAGTRLSFRLLGELLRPGRENFRRILIYGAGDGGELILRELRNNAGLRRQPVGFLDDDRVKVGTRIHEVPVLGGLDRIELVLAAQDVAEVIVSSGKIPAERVKRLKSACAARGVPVVHGSLRLE